MMTGPVQSNEGEASLETDDKAVWYERLTRDVFCAQDGATGEEQFDRVLIKVVGRNVSRSPRPSLALRGKGPLPDLDW